MALKIPTPQQTLNFTKQLFQKEIPEANPDLQASFVGFLVKALSLLISKFFQWGDAAYKNNFFSTARGDALDLKGQDIGLPRLLETQATGLLVVNADDIGEIIPASSEFTFGNEIYTNNSLSISVNRLNSVVTSVYSGISEKTTITTLDIHNLASNMDFVKGIIPFTVDSIEDEFTFLVDGDVSTDIMTADVLEVISHLITVISNNKGTAMNVTGDLLFSTIVVTNQVRTTYAGINGGIDTEIDATYRSRLLDNVTIKGAGTTELNLRALMDTNSLSYILISQPTSSEGGDPDVGETKVYALRNNETFTSSLEKTQIKDLALTLLGTNNDPDNLTILDPTLIPFDFEITSLEINQGSNVVNATSDMQVAVTNSLTDFFKSEVFIGKIVDRGKYTNAVSRAVDQFGNTVSSFTITVPVGELSINNNQKATLGVITYN